MLRGWCGGGLGRRKWKREEREREIPEWDHSDSHSQWSRHLFRSFSFIFSLSLGIRYFPSGATGRPSSLLSLSLFCVQAKCNYSPSFSSPLLSLSLLSLVCLFFFVSLCVLFVFYFRFLFAKYLFVNFIFFLQQSGQEMEPVDVEVVKRVIQAQKIAKPKKKAPPKQIPSTITLEDIFNSLPSEVCFCLTLYCHVTTCIYC